MAPLYSKLESTLRLKAQARIETLPARRAFRLPVLAPGLSLMAWGGLTFSAVAPPGRDMEIGFGKYTGMRMSELVEEVYFSENLQRRMGKPIDLRRVEEE